MIHIRRFTDANIPFGMALKVQAGWNQLPGDWERMLALEPQGGFIAEWNHQPAGTVMVTVFYDVAWISMMLVDAAHRRRGLGRALMDAALEYTMQHGCSTVRLDATPSGQPLYEQLGFVPEFELWRLSGVPFPTSGETVMHPTIDEVMALDCETTGTNRERLLSVLHHQQPFWGVLGEDTLRGFISARPGSHSVQIGPCAADELAGPILFRHAFARYAGQPVIIDIPASHITGIELAQRHGLSHQRTLLRMTRGKLVAERVDRLWASFGPEKG